MRKETHYIFILLTGITIRLGTDKKKKINQFHLAKREIEMVRTGLETGTKKIPLCWNKFNSSPLLQTLTRLLSESTSIPAPCSQSPLLIARALKSYPSLASPATRPQGTGSLYLLDQQSQN